jgi:hypothetical protein
MDGNFGMAGNQEEEIITFARVREHLELQYRSFVKQHEQSFAMLLNCLESEYASMHHNLQQHQEIARQRIAENEEYYKSLQQKEETIERNKEMYQHQIREQMEQLKAKEAEMLRIYNRKNVSVKVKFFPLMANHTQQYYANVLQLQEKLKVKGDVLQMREREIKQAEETGLLQNITAQRGELEKRIQVQAASLTIY